MKPATEKKPETPALPAPSYPALELFIETATEAEVDVLYAPLMQALTEVKGLQEAKAKKAERAIVKSLELLNLLLGVRARLEEEAAARGRPSR